MHSGNILINENDQTLKISELENFICDLPVKNEQYYYFIYEEFNLEKNNIYINPNFDNLKESKKHIHNNNNDIFSDIFKNQYNSFEKLDLISFGRILYEMATGKELKAPYPDELEYKDMDTEISLILRMIFQKKNSKFNKNNNKNSDLSAKELLKLNFFNPETSYDLNTDNKKRDISNNKEKITENNQENGKITFQLTIINYFSFIKIILTILIC